VKTTDFDFSLPPSAIAQVPLGERDASRLMVLDRGASGVAHHVFRDLPELLAPGDLVVVNRSRVFPARLLGTRGRGGRAEVLLVRRLDDERWQALLRPGRRLPAGARVTVSAELSVTVMDGEPDADGARPVRLSVAPGVSVDRALQRWGHWPLPPYIERPDSDEDRERYQAIYAREQGSVAAPTAGLHFTESLLARLEARGVERAELLLHVGPGTFRPVKALQVEQHRVDAEQYLIPAATVEAVRRARARGARVVAVGTTTTRALEAAAGDDGVPRPGLGSTDLVITPGFRFRTVDALVTNFHLPRSSLLLLVSAFAGRERVLAAYAQAVTAGYRFYSYGDAMLLL
jgi:S-adenosylmethionine:tRNA ribosyltransferase-isomerase